MPRHAAACCCRWCLVTSGDARRLSKFASWSFRVRVHGFSAMTCVHCLSQGTWEKYLQRACVGRLPSAHVPLRLGVPGMSAPACFTRGGGGGGGRGDGEGSPRREEIHAIRGATSRPLELALAQHLLGCGSVVGLLLSPFQRHVRAPRSCGARHIQLPVRLRGGGGRLLRGSCRDAAGKHRNAVWIEPPVGRPRLREPLGRGRWGS